MSYGGGFSTTTYGGDGGGMGASQGESGGKAAYGKDTLRPLTIKQLLEAEQVHTDGDFSVDGTEISQITIVGQIRNITTQTTNILYKVDDGTGIVEVRQWVDVDKDRSEMDTSGDGDSKASPPVEKDWVRIWGRMKSFQEKRHLGAHFVRKITDKNEIHYHLLEATYVHLFLSRGPIDQNNGTGQQAQGQGQAQAQGNGVGAGAGPASLSGVSNNARKVYMFIKSQPKNHEGLHNQYIAAGLGMDLSDVTKAGAELMEAGNLYQTVDDFTWMVMD